MSQGSNIPIEIDVPTVKAMRDRNEDFLLLDVRQPTEHATAHIEGAVLIPIGEIEGRVGELEAHRNRPIVVHCHRGGRSLRVTQWLRSLGYQNVRNLTGGIDAWSLTADSSVPRY
jgi:rhodanese-related sulfurtransferase